MPQSNKPHKPKFCLLAREPTTNRQLLEQAKLNKDIAVRILANQHLLALMVYNQWWEGVKIEQK